MSAIDENFSAYVVPNKHHTFYKAGEQKVPYARFTYKIRAEKRKDHRKEVAYNAHNGIYKEGFYGFAVFLLLCRAEDEYIGKHEIHDKPYNKACGYRGGNLPLIVLRSAEYPIKYGVIYAHIHKRRNTAHNCITQKFKQRVFFHFLHLENNIYRQGEFAFIAAYHLVHFLFFV